MVKEPEFALYQSIFREHNISMGDGKDTLTIAGFQTEKPGTIIEFKDFRYKTSKAKEIRFLDAFCEKRPFEMSRIDGDLKRAKAVPVANVVNGPRTSKEVVSLPGK